MEFSRSSNDSLLLCTCSLDLIMIWDVKNLKGNKINSFLEYEPTQCVFDPDNKSLAVINGDNLLIFDISSSTVVNQLKFKNYLNNIEYCLFDRNSILITDQNNSLLVS